MTVLSSWLVLASATEADSQTSAGDVVGAVLLAGVALFFLWLVVAVVRKKLSSSRGRIGEYHEDEGEAARTARLWAEARRRTAEEEPEAEEEAEEAEEEGEPVDIQSELLQRAAQRRQEQLQASQEQTPEQAPEEEPAEAAEQETEPEERKPAPARPAPLAAPRTLEQGLQKTRDGFVSRLRGMFGRANLAEEELEQIEEILFTADIGVRTSQKLIEFLQQETSRAEKADPQKLLGALKARIEQMLRVEAPALDLKRVKPLVILVVGVNGTGKTTSIGKLAMHMKTQGLRVVLAAADTFRAAAREQLEIWAERAGAKLVSGQEGADPGAVVFDAITTARSQGLDVVIADTAGRLHTKVNLVEELRKVHRVCGKAQEGAPHEVLLVLDATTGQNAISQAKQFHQALQLTGLLLTKLDGTAKGGIVIGVSDTFGIPVRFIGIGESVEDLRPFDPAEFVQALFRV